MTILCRFFKSLITFARIELWSSNVSRLKSAMYWNRLCQARSQERYKVDEASTLTNVCMTSGAFFSTFFAECVQLRPECEKMDYRFYRCIYDCLESPENEKNRFDGTWRIWKCKAENFPGECFAPWSKRSKFSKFLNRLKMASNDLLHAHRRLRCAKWCRKMDSDRNLMDKMKNEKR